MHLFTTLKLYNLQLIAEMRKTEVPIIIYNLEEAADLLLRRGYTKELLDLVETLDKAGLIKARHIMHHILQFVSLRDDWMLAEKVYHKSQVTI